MSRHRFVRNMDLGAELADDHPDDYDDEGGYSGEGGYTSDEPDDGMDPEERAQMESTFPLVKEKLKDIKPPITEAAIKDSLWHYWFDVDKAASWLRKDWEKKGDPPAFLIPSPDQQPRPRPSARRAQEIVAPKLEPVTALLTPLQRLKLQREKRNAASGTSSPSTASALPSVKPSTTVSPAPTPPLDEARPKSKLALLAQKRRENASKESTTPSSTSPAASSTDPTPPPADAPAKPISKLAQKMAAARAARAVAPKATAEASVGETSAIDFPSTAVAAEPADEEWEFLPKAKIAQARATPSVFFSLLTTRKQAAVIPDPPSLANMHIAVRGDRAAAEKRVREAFGPGVESPDDIVLRARAGRAGAGDGEATQTKSAVRATKVEQPAPEPVSEAAAAMAKPKEEDLPGPEPAAKGTKPSTKHSKPPKASEKPPVARGSRIAKAAVPPAARSKSLPAKQRVMSSGPGTPSRSTSNAPSSRAPSSKASSKPGSNVSTPRRGTGTPLSLAASDLAELGLEDSVDEEFLRREAEKYREVPVPTLKQEELVAKVKEDEEKTGKKNISLVVVGHVDAGKSTLMGRLLYDLGEMSEKEKTANERGSLRVGKSSFAFAWGLDALGDERDRGVTIDIATEHFETPHRNVTLLDAPGHRDFIPAMISGAAQADVALLVIDASPNAFEAGFERGGQTREHAWLVRSLGVKEIIVGVNKMDVVDWDQYRYEDIVAGLKPFLAAAGFAGARTTFLPLAAMKGTNILNDTLPEDADWYKGPSLMAALDRVAVPERPYSVPLRIPISNVFKGQTAIASGVACQGRLASGVVQVGDQVRVVPGDVVASIRTIEVDDDSAPFAVAGQNVTLYLAGVDANQLSIGAVLCPVSYPIRMVSRFQSQILVFDVTTPIIMGTAVELFHHSVNVPANITRLIATTDRTGNVIKNNPRVLQKGTTAVVELTLRAPTGSTRPAIIPLETAKENKEMGRVLLRRGGETIAAGVVTELL
ncbi:hypothetical protein CcaverHIS631_0208260 [Cutaneotrichosporon cavernicola]|nr:hypothetical protein CcaverHIS631_0208260 [Cutaneotrichosporon cavernicola]